MENPNDPHPDYLKGFNEGYALAEHAPEIGNQIAELLKDFERGQGFLDGREQYQVDKSVSRLPNWLKENLDDFEPSKDHEMDKEDNKLDQDEY